MFVALLPVGLVLLLTGTKNRSSIADAEFARAEAASDRVTIELERYLTMLEQFALQLQGDAMLNDPDTPSVARDRELQRMVDEHELVDSAQRISLPSSTDRIEVRSKPPETNLFWRVRMDKTGEVIELSAPLARIWRIIDPAQLGQTGGGMLLDKTGRVLSHRNKTLIHSQPNTANIGNGDELYINAMGESFYTIANPIGSPTGRSDLQLELVFLIPAGPINDLILQTGIMQIAIGMFTSIVAWVLGSVLAGRLASGLEDAAKVAQEVAGGKTAARMPNEGPVEMRRLGVAFNNMIDKLKAHQDGLEQLVKERTSDLEALSEQHKQLAAQLKAANDASEDGVWLVSLDGKPLSHNRAFCSLFGVEGETIDIVEIGEQVLAKFEDSEAVMDWMGDAFQSPNNGPQQGRWPMCDRENGMMAGYWAPVANDVGEIFAVLFAFRDLTQEYQLQAELADARRMETLGNLTSSIAHEFNNLLSSVIGNIELVRPEKDSPLNDAHAAANRAVEMVRGLLGFSQQNWLEIEPVDLRDLVMDIQRRYYSSGKRVTWEFDFPSDLRPLAADRTKIRQVMEELIDNAIDASPTTCAICFSASNLQVGDEHRVEIRISDRGNGTAPHMLDRMFEPFVSTKEGHRGLGLAMCHGVVLQHGGVITSEANSDGGLTMVLDLIAADVEEVVPVRYGLASDQTRPALSEGAVLVVDDDPRVRLVTEAILRKGGYRVLSAENGVQALDAFKKLGEHICLVVLDLRMPGMMGTEVLESLRKDHDYVPVVICSGYLGDFDPNRLEGLIGPQALLEKPVSAKKLLEVAESAIALGG